MQKIILDTSFILTALKFKIDFLSELNKLSDFNYELYVLDKTIDELKNKPLGKLAEELIKQKNIKIIRTDKGKVDDLLLEQEGIIATQDMELKKLLKAKNKRIITIRQKRFLIQLPY